MLIDADSRGILTRVELPNLNAQYATALFSAMVTDVVDPEVGELISQVSPSHGGESLRWAAAVHGATICYGSISQAHCVPEGWVWVVRLDAQAPSTDDSFVYCGR